MLKIIGSVECCALKEFGIPAIDARIDTGAQTSSLHATKIEVFRKKKVKWVRFEVAFDQDEKQLSFICETPVLTRRTVKTSNENSEKRLIIKTPLTIGETTFQIELTLANRENMEYKMLLGREALNGRFLVNPAESYLV
ncbi:MAG: RimK/LysX family protein [Muriicola sp.]